MLFRVVRGVEREIFFVPWKCTGEGVRVLYRMSVDVVYEACDAVKLPEISQDE